MSGNQAKQKIKEALEMVAALCKGERKWIMSVPARPDYDPDLVVCAGLRAAELEIERLEAREIELTLIVNSNFLIACKNGEKATELLAALERIANGTRGRAEMIARHAIAKARGQHE